MGNTFDFILSPEQFSKYIWHKHTLTLRRLPFRLAAQAVLMLGWFALVFFFFGIFGTAPKWISISALGIVFATLWTASFLQRRGLDRIYRRKNHLAGVPCRLTVDEEGLRHSSPGCELLMGWSRLAGIDETDDVVTVHVDEIYSLPIPASAFGSKEEKEAFIAHVRSKIGSSALESSRRPEESAATTEAIADPPQEATRTVTRNAAAFFGNVLNGFRLMFFRRVEAERIAVAWWQVAAFALAGLAIPFLHDLASVGFNGYFGWWGIPSALVHVPVILFAAIASASALGRSEKTLLLLQIFFMIAIAIDIVLYSADFAVHAIYPHFLSLALLQASAIVPVVWLGLACARAAANFSASFRRGALACTACFVLLAGPLFAMGQERSLWYPARAGEADGGNYLKGLSEEALYNQPKLLDKELAAVHAGRPGVIDVYFIGVAGYSTQDVFMKEVESVDAMFRSRFGSAEKTIRLVNNRNSAERLPLATVTSIGAALNRVGKVMDRDEDILFLFLTSHGSESPHRLSLNFWPLSLTDLDPGKLRALLDESGVRNRVVVVSACYSGGFIEPLKDENTLIITASAADRNSFGCSNEAEWTYFGKAYFDEALRKTYSFVEAFAAARQSIEDREKKEGNRPSQPQMSVGEGIKAKLAALQMQLERQ
ncbi:MAG TPA: C13 family peptidase [Candidatus Binatia bacterium]|jgi:hypothetical protein